LREAAGPTGVKQLAERTTIYIVEDQEGSPFVLVDVLHPNYVGVLNTAGKLGFEKQSSSGILV
jgi:hypothetical protein